MNSQLGIVSLSSIGSNLDEKTKRQLVQQDPDFVNLKRFNYSLEELLERYPDEVPNGIIANALMLEESEVEDLYQSVVGKLRELMSVQ